MNKKEAEDRLKEYVEDMTDGGLGERTISQYESAIRRWLMMQTDTIDAAAMRRYKNYLLDKYAVSSVNVKLIAVNRYIRWLGYNELTVRIERLQTGDSLENIITQNNYRKMLDYARKTGRMKMYCLMRTIALTGIRVGELKYITVEAVRSGNVKVYNKGKHRRIYLPQKLCRELNDYCKENGIESGVIFSGRDKGKCITSSGVWKNLKYIARQANVPEAESFPHSFRHLFAKTYMREIGDVTELSDLLGHCSLKTTCIYTRTTADEKRKRLDRISL